MKIQKRLASQLLKASSKRIRFDNQRIADIDEAITKTDVRVLIDEKAITRVQKKGVSRARARKTQSQKAKGKRKGKGSREGKKTARLPAKKQWMAKIRSQRELLKNMKDNNSISKESYRELYRKSKGGYFRSKRHIKIYCEDNKLFLVKQKKPEVPKKPVEKKEAPKKVVKKTVKKKTVKKSEK